MDEPPPSTRGLQRTEAEGDAPTTPPVLPGPIPINHRLFNTRGASDARLLELDALRGIASLAVLAFHYAFRYNQIFAEGDDDKGGGEVPWLRALGVPLFFIISGFVIPMTLDKGLRGAQGLRANATAVWNFAAARFARLYPAFWAAVAVTFTVVSIAGLKGREVGWQEALANLTMIPHSLVSLAHDFGWVPRKVGVDYVDGAYWSLEAEWLFYALVAVVALAGWRRYLHWVLAIMVVIDLFRPNGPMKEFVASGGPQVVSAMKSLGKFGLPSGAHVFFLTGLLIYELRRAAKWWQPLLLALCFVRLAASRRSDLYTAIYALDVVLVWAAVNFRVPLLANRVLVFAGTISYSLYLIHQNIGYIVIGRALGAGWPQAAAIVAAFAVAIGLATAITFLIERPCNTTLRKWLMRKTDAVKSG